MVEPGQLPETEGLREFASRLGCKPGYVTQLKEGGRLVLTEDGRRVRVAESLRLIDATRDPSKEGVRARHAAARGHDKENAPSVAAAGPEGPRTTADAADEPIDPEEPIANNPHSMRRSKALADKEEALARKALREEQIEMGQLLVKTEVLTAVTDGVTQLRSELERLPPSLAPRLAAIADEDEVLSMLRDAIERALEQLVRKFSEIGKGKVNG